jgi:hypothetical protein
MSQTFHRRLDPPTGASHAAPLTAGVEKLIRYCYAVKRDHTAPLPAGSVDLVVRPSLSKAFALIRKLERRLRGVRPVRRRARLRDLMDLETHDAVLAHEAIEIGLAQDQ